MPDHTAEKDAPRNYLAPDGYRYGVMFSDGSVSERWNGRTQREQAQRDADDAAREYAPDRITLARRKPGEPWERVIPPGVTAIEDGCTCGGMAACQQCQDRDATGANGARIGEALDDPGDPA
jgi:hypothetical protein